MHFGLIRSFDPRNLPQRGDSTLSYPDIGDLKVWFYVVPLLAKITISQSE